MTLTGPRTLPNSRSGNIVDIHEWAVPEIYDRTLENPSWPVSREVGLLYQRLRQGSLPAFIIRKTSESSEKLEDLHGRRIELLREYESLGVSCTTPYFSKAGSKPYLHIDGGRKTQTVTVHTTSKNGAKAWFSRGGPELVDFARTIETHAITSSEFADESVPTYERLFETMTDLFNDSKTDSNLCQPDFFVAHLGVGDSVIFENKFVDNVWHCFKNEPTDLKRTALISTVELLR